VQLSTYLEVVGSWRRSPPAPLRYGVSVSRLQLWCPLAPVMIQGQRSANLLFPSPQPAKLPFSSSSSSSSSSSLSSPSSSSPPLLLFRLLRLSPGVALLRRCLRVHVAFVVVVVRKKSQPLASLCLSPALFPGCFQLDLRAFLLLLRSPAPYEFFCTEQCR
jgi:hypothetical protein